MARSQDSSNKKEKEKKRQKNKQDKEARKEERKANSSKGKGLDEMLAYVDENGNISSTPPDPAKKKKIDLEDIQIAVPKQEALELSETTRKGVVTFFNDAKGYGFIKEVGTQDSIFVHVNGLTEQVKQNDKVTFEVEMGQKGPVAIEVKVIRQA
ncbi:MAG: cold shock domain-containing protein [Bacteroidota bacterium]|nr:cold shock domain-containing protein [Bacteroidota bacterium]